MIRDLTYQSADDSVVLDVLVNDTDIDAGDKTTLHVVSAASAASAKGASVTFSRLPGAGIVYSPGGAFDYLAAGQTTIDTVTYTIQDSHSASSMTTALVTIHGLNDAPVFAGEGSVGYIPGDAAVTVISGDVTASDVDSDNYDGGSFTAIVTAGGHEGDTLTVAHNEFISVVSVASGHVVMFDADGRGDAFNAVAIGDLQNNYGNANSLTVNLNGNATDAAVDALAQAIQFGNGKSDAAAGARAVTFTLHDGGGTADGGHNSDYFEAAVNVTPLPPQDGPSSSSGQIELNHVPVAHDDNIIAASTAFAIDGDHATLSLDNNLLLANDIDADVDATFISSAYSIQPGHGSVSQPNIGFTDYVLTSAGDLPTGESLLLDNFAYAVLDGHSVSSAATVHLTVVAALSMDGGPGATLVDTSADNILFGGMVQGPDTFVFAARSGHDTIVNFASGQDHIDLQFGAPFSSNDETSFQAWATSSNHVVQQGHDTLITFDASSSILLKNVAAVHANDFILHPAT
jgi:hypothetical protein